jgi:hypothetical protein
MAAVMPPCTEASGLNNEVSQPPMLFDQSLSIPRACLALRAKGRSTRSLVEVTTILLSWKTVDVRSAGRLHGVEYVHSAH